MVRDGAVRWTALSSSPHPCLFPDLHFPLFMLLPPPNLLFPWWSRIFPSLLPVSSCLQHYLHVTPSSWQENLLFLSGSLSSPANTPFLSLFSFCYRYFLPHSPQASIHSIRYPLLARFLILALWAHHKQCHLLGCVRHYTPLTALQWAGVVRVVRVPYTGKACYWHGDVWHSLTHALVSEAKVKATSAPLQRRGISKRTKGRNSAEIHFIALTLSICTECTK